MVLKQLALISGIVIYTWFGWCSLQLSDSTEYDKVILFLSPLYIALKMVWCSALCVITNLATEGGCIVNCCSGLICLIMPGPEVSQILCSCIKSLVLMIKNTVYLLNSSLNYCGSSWILRDLEVIIILLTNNILFELYNLVWDGHKIQGLLGLMVIMGFKGRIWVLLNIVKWVYIEIRLVYRISSSKVLLRLKVVLINISLVLFKFAIIFKVFSYYIVESFVQIMKILLFKGFGIRSKINYTILGLGTLSSCFMFSTVLGLKDKDSEAQDSHLSPPIFSNYGVYSLLAALIFGNIFQRVQPHLGQYRMIAALLDQGVWGIPAIISLTGFNWTGLVYYLQNSIKNKLVSYIINESLPSGASNNFHGHAIPIQETSYDIFNNNLIWILLIFAILILMIVCLMIIKIAEIIFKPASLIVKLDNKLGGLNTLETHKPSELDPILSTISQEFLAEPSKFKNDAQKISKLLYDLKDKHKDWLTQKLDSCPELRVNYAEVVKLLRSNFPVFKLINKSGLYDIKQTGSVDDYNNKFLRIIQDLGCNEDEIKHIYIKGLKDVIKVLINFKYEDSLEDLMKAAKIGESKMPYLNNISHVNYNNLSLDSQNNNSFQRLPNHVYEERKANRLCFHCGGKNHLASNCFQNKRRLNFKSNNEIKSEIQSYPSISISLLDVNNKRIIISALLDSGAQSSFITESLANRLGLKLTPRPPGRLGDGSQFQLWKTSPINFTFENLNFNEEVLVAKSLQHEIILGYPWWVKHDLKINYKEGTISLGNGDNRYLSFIELDHLLEIQTEIKPLNIPIFLDRYKEVFDENLCRQLPPHCEIDISIELDPEGKLPKYKSYLLSHKDGIIVKEYLEENLAKGYIRQSNSPCSSPLFLVKKEGSVPRPCGNYQHLNSITRKDRFPIPGAETLTDQLTGAKIFSKVDLKSAFNQVRIKQGDEWKTAFITPHGLYEYLVMPFGLANAPATFQRFISEILFDYIGQFLVIYLDDILIYSKDEEEHKDHLMKLFQRLMEHRLYVKDNKCEFLKDEIEFLGYKIVKGGFAVSPSKVQAIQDWPQPSNRKALRGFLGLTNYCRKFIPGYSEIALPLTEMTSNKKKYQWTPVMNDSFLKLKKEFTKAPLLLRPDQTKPFKMVTDASDFAIGAMLFQNNEDGEDQPVAFYSKKLIPAERNYDVFDKELMAILFSLRHWKRYLQGTDIPITIYSDHKNLVTFTTQRKRKQRHYRWEEELNQYNFQIKHIEGDSNIVADCLSRRPDHKESKEYIEQNSQPILKSSCLLNQIVVPVDNLYQRVLESQEKIEFSTILSKSGYTKDNDGTILYFGKILVLDSAIQREILQFYHDSRLGGHNGTRRTLSRIRSTYNWRGMKKQVQKYIKKCHHCNLSKPNNYKPFGLIQSIQKATRPWSSVTMDFITDLPESEGFNSILVIVDRYTKMVVLCPVRKSISSEEVAKIFLKEIISRYGSPKEIISDQGVQFTSKFWKRTAELMDIKICLSSAYHPETDGQTERYNRTLEQYLRCYINEEQNNWVELLPLAQLNLNSAEHTSIGMSPFKALFGFNPEISLGTPEEEKVPAAEERIQNLKENQIILEENLKKAQQDYMKYSDQKRQEGPDYQVEDYVYLDSRNFLVKGSKKLSPKYLGPFQIIEKINNVAYKLELPESWRKHNVFHKSLLKPAEKPSSPIINPQNLKDEYEVEKILDHKGAGRGYKYLVSWKGYDWHESSWEPEANLTHCQELLKVYKSLKGI